MQDIAGCRLVVDNRWDQEVIVASLSPLFPGAKAQPTDPERSHGYRAVHLIPRIQSRPIEIQVRTSLQHFWASTVEVVSDDYGVDFKHGMEMPEGREPILRWLKTASHLLDRIGSVDDRDTAAGWGPEDLAKYRLGQVQAIMMTMPYIADVVI